MDWHGGTLPRSDHHPFIPVCQSSQNRLRELGTARTPDPRPLKPISQRASPDRMNAVKAHLPTSNICLKPSTRRPARHASEVEYGIPSDAPTVGEVRLPLTVGPGRYAKLSLMLHARAFSLGCPFNCGYTVPPIRAPPPPFMDRLCLLVRRVMRCFVQQ
jgi:hypothetical protein